LMPAIAIDAILMKIAFALLTLLPL
jgi:hypothetical protein